MSGFDDADRKKAGVLPHDLREGCIPFDEWEAKTFPEAKVTGTAQAAFEAPPSDQPVEPAPSASVGGPDHATIVAEVVAASRLSDPAAVDRVVEQHRVLIAKMGDVTRETIVDTITAQARHLNRGALSKSFRKAAKPKLHLVTAASVPPARVMDFVADAPVDAGCIVPAGFRLGSEGVDRLTKQEEWVETCPVPVVISETSRRLEDGREQLTLHWVDARTGKWISTTTGREVPASKSGIVSLAAVGFPVTSSTSTGLVDYIAKYQSVNAKFIPRRDAVGKCGWLEDERFILGNETVCIATGSRVTFTSDGPGEAAFVDAIIACGSYEVWRELVMEVVQKYPIAATALYAALASPLLKILHAQNFFVHLSGDTSKGKSTSLSLAMSAWGDPAPGKLVRSWASTLVGVERLAAVSNDIGIALDEAQAAEGEFLAKVLYLFTSGVGKGRGAKTGSQSSPSWRAVCLSAGERALESDVKFGGAGARVLTLYGSPFGDDGKLAEKVSEVVAANHGFAGARLVRALLDRRSDWPKLRDMYKQAVERWAVVLQGEARRRRAQFFAVLEVAAMLIHEVLVLPGDPVETLKAAAKSLSSAPAQENYARAAFNVVYEFAVANQASFLGSEKLVNGKPVLPNEYFGNWTKGDRLAFIPEVFDRVLKQSGYDARTVLSAFGRNEWLKRDGDNLKAKATGPGGKRVRMVVIGVTTGKDGGEPMKVPEAASGDEEADEVGQSGADSGGDSGGGFNSDSDGTPF